MRYIEYVFSQPRSEEQRDMLVALLSDLGFDSFYDDDEGFKAYTPVEDNNDAVTALLDMDCFEGVTLNKVELMPDKNWNEIWEASYQAVVVNERCRVRAPFHPADESFEFDLVIEPKMSFGTANHETTAQMIQLMLDTPFENYDVLDMGSGTAVLAILAVKLEAKSVLAVDNDEWAYNNAFTNIELNGVDSIEVLLGDASSLGGRSFDIVLANINRNILLRDMNIYVDTINPGGKLFMSGFYLEDLPLIRDEAERLGLVYHRHLDKNNWVAVEFHKK